MNEKIKTNNKPLIFFSIATFLIGQLMGIVSFLFFPFHPNSQSLIYPAIYPPVWVFIVVWMIIYPCMGLSMGYIYKLKKKIDITGILFYYIIMLTANVMFLPIMNISKGNPAIMTFLDFNGIVSSSLFSWLCFKYSKTAFYWSLPLAVWMPVTFIIKVALWNAN